MSAQNDQTRWPEGSIRVCPTRAGRKVLLGGLLSAAMLLGSGAASADPIIWYAARSPVAKTNWLKGEDRCTHGSEDCNRCAPDVQGQWSDMAAGALAWLEREWFFEWEGRVPPSQVEPDQAWEEFDAHAQGFVRTNHPTVKYAMSHSDDDIGTLTFIDNNDDIHALHRTINAHPSGIFTLGRYVGTMDGTSLLRFFDTTRSLESHNLSFLIQAKHGPATLSGNGGLAMAKLFGGGYLLVVGQGGTDNDPQNNYLYFVDGPLTSPRRIEFLNTHRPSASQGFNQSENISMITECGTRDIYTVHMFGDDLGGQGYYALNKVVWGNISPYLERVNVKVVNSDIDYCHHRSAASASVRDNGYIDLYCHERSATEDLFGNSDSWEFREGLNYFNW